MDNKKELLQPARFRLPLRLRRRYHCNRWQEITGSIPSIKRKPDTSSECLVMSSSIGFGTGENG